MVGGCPTPRPVMELVWVRLGWRRWCLLVLGLRLVLGLVWLLVMGLSAGIMLAAWSGPLLCRF